MCCLAYDLPSPRCKIGPIPVKEHEISTGGFRNGNRRHRRRLTRWGNDVERVVQTKHQRVIIIAPSFVLPKPGHVVNPSCVAVVTADRVIAIFRDEGQSNHGRDRERQPGNRLVGKPIIAAVDRSDIRRQHKARVLVDAGISRTRADIRVNIRATDIEVEQHISHRAILFLTPAGRESCAAVTIVVPPVVALSLETKPVPKAITDTSDPDVTRVETARAVSWPRRAGYGDAHLLALHEIGSADCTNIKASHRLRERGITAGKQSRENRGGEQCFTRHRVPFRAIHIDALCT